MRVVLVVVLCGVVSIQATFPQMRRLSLQNPLRLRHAVALRSSNAAIEPLGPMHFHGVVAKLPTKYQPLTNADEYAAKQLMTLIPEILSQFPPVYTIDKLGPINVDLPEFWLRGKLYLNNIAVKGINLATLQHLEMRMNNLRADFVAHAPRISADVNFELDAHLGVVPLFLTGTVSVNVQDLNPSGAVGVKLVNLPLIGKVYQASSADISVDVKSLGINIKNGNTGELEKDDMENLKKKILEEIKDEVADIAVSVILKEVNKELAKFTADELLALVTKSG